MNGAIIGGMSGTSINIIQSYIAQYRGYFKASDLAVPGPATAWVVCDESMYSPNDGYLQADLNTPGNYPDVPAAYDNGGNCFSFADGHVEYRKWQFHDAKFGILNCPYRYNTTGQGAYWTGGGAFDVDW